MAFHEVVRRRKWLSLEEFTEIMALCQILPGPNVVNFSVAFGMKKAGWAGAAACFGGLMLMPIAIVMTLATIYAGFSDVPEVSAAFRAIAAAAAGLVCAMTLRLMWPVLREFRAIVVIVVVFALMAVVRVPLFYIIVTMGPLSIALAALLRRNGR